jgi:hypothetical protein
MRHVERMANAQEAHEVDEWFWMMNMQYIYAQQLLEKKHVKELTTMIHSQDMRRAEHDAKMTKEMEINQLRVDNLKRQLDDASDPVKVWNLFHRHDRNPGEGKGAVTLYETPKGKNLYYLTLPPLEGPRSVRRRAASKRNLTMTP